MAKFRKKPVVIEALEYDGDLESRMAIITWGTDERPIMYDGETLRVATLEGEMTISVGDWVIKGVAGECYPCKPDIFEKTYELVEEV